MLDLVFFHPDSGKYRNISQNGFFSQKFLQKDTNTKSFYYETIVKSLSISKTS